MELAALNYSNLDWFLPNYSLKIFHKLKFMTLFFFQFFLHQWKLQLNRWTGNLLFIS